MKKSLIALCCVLSGCATTPPAPPVEMPTCDGAADCAAKWEAAQLYVVKHAGMKIQNVTSVLIETFNPPQYGTDLAMRVTKEPMGGGSYRLVIDAWCNNMFGCGSPPRSVEADFARVIAATGE